MSEEETQVVEQVEEQVEETQIKQESKPIDIGNLKSEDVDNFSEDQERDVAMQMGWKDPKDYKGNKSRLVDPKTFIKNGITKLPILKNNYGKVLEEMNGLKELIVTMKKDQAGQISKAKEKERSKLEDKIKSLEADATAAEEDYDTQKLKKTMNQIQDTKEKIKEYDKKVEPKQPDMDPYVGEYGASEEGQKMQNDAGLRTLFMGKLNDLDRFSSNKSVKVKFQEAAAFVKAEMPHKFSTSYTTNASLGAGNASIAPKGRTFSDLNDGDKNTINRAIKAHVEYKQRKGGFTNEKQKKAFVEDLKKDYLSEYLPE